MTGLVSRCTIVVSCALVACVGQSAASVQDATVVDARGHSSAALSDTPAGHPARLLPVREASAVHAFEAMGRLLAPPLGRAEVTLPLPSSIVMLRVAPGDYVSAGQVLIDVVIGEAARAQGQFDGARLRAEALAARLLQLEQLRSEGLARGGELAEAKARLAEVKASEREAQAVIDSVISSGVRRKGKDYVVVAPIAGIVVFVDAPIGSVRGPSDGPICLIAHGAATRVEARFGFTLPSGLSFELWANDQRVSSLVLVAQSPEINAGDATRLAWFDLVQPTQLVPGTTVQLRPLLQPGTWVVPRSAISRSLPLEVNTAERGRVPLELLTELGSEALVRGALRADDLVLDVEVSP
ncbi:MAG: hypothetical protein RL701_1232 [Pseudomonadota bacterium]